MSPASFEVTASPGLVWRVGFEPDMWAWTPWQYATDSGLFDGRWDDQLGEFRTLYTSDRLLGCLLELLAKFRPSTKVSVALDQVIDDDGTGQQYPDGPDGGLGHGWLEHRLYGQAEQDGKYCFITHSSSLAALLDRYPFGRHGLTPADIDAALLKDGRNRTLTRSIARWIYDLRDGKGTELVDGIEFRSRYGDELKVWAVFERSRDGASSLHLHPRMHALSIPDDLPELIEAFRIHELAWAD